LQLYPFQQEGVENLVKRRSVLFADEMGLGKTVQAAVALRCLFDSRSISRVLIAAPIALTRNWKSELRKWAALPGVLYEGGSRYGLLEGNAAVLIGSYETICSDLEVATRGGERFHDLGIDVLIIDEAQRIKTPETVRARVLAKIVAPRRWAITGTPLENRPRELASILRYLFPNEFETADSLEDLPRILAYRDQAMFRRTKGMVGLQLPSKTVANISVALSPDQAAEYSQRLNDLKQELARGSGDRASLMRLLAGIQDLRRIAVISSNQDSSKLDFLESQLENICSNGEKAVVFSSFANIALPLFRERLSRFGAVLYTGAMSTDERERIHQRFIEDPSTRVMCASLKAAGVGLTWTVASHVFHTDVWWNPQVLNQADDRVHRIGQQKPVLVRRLVADGTIEEAINQLLETKEDIFKMVVDEAPPASITQRTYADLLALIGLKSAARSSPEKTY
jgi:SNF2 family DNA or RNA helicase